MDYISMENLKTVFGAVGKTLDRFDLAYEKCGLFDCFIVMDPFNDEGGFSAFAVAGGEIFARITGSYSFPFVKTAQEAFKAGRRYLSDNDIPLTYGDDSDDTSLFRMVSVEELDLRDDTAGSPLFEALSDCFRSELFIIPSVLCPCMVKKGGGKVGDYTVGFLSVSPNGISNIPSMVLN